MPSNPPRIAIPIPHSGDREYADRSIPHYEHAVQFAGGEAIRIPLESDSRERMKIIESCDAVLLPGSKADIEPEEFGAVRSLHTAAPDHPRDEVDRALLKNAYESKKPILGICYGLQSLNVYRGGSLIQHIPDFLPEELKTRVDHEAGRTVAVAHEVEVERNSKLAKILFAGDGKLTVPVNSSHHQSADRVGAELRISARCREDGIVEAIEGTSPDHFVVAVQWHPERSVDSDEVSGKLFRALVDAAKLRQGQLKK